MVSTVHALKIVIFQRSNPEVAAKEEDNKKTNSLSPGFVASTWYVLVLNQQSNIVTTNFTRLCHFN